MTIEEIKSVSIVQFLEAEGYPFVSILRGNYWYLSPLRTESTPSFNVSSAKNLWHDFGIGEGGNLINLVQKLHPAWNNHEVLGYLENKIKEHNLQFAVDYEARRREDMERAAWNQNRAYIRKINNEANTIIESVGELSHPYLKDYILKRRVNFDLAREYCREIHYRIYDKHYYAIAFENIEGGMEVRNKYSKRSIGKKSISIVTPGGKPHAHCCVFEGFFDMLTYASIKRWQMDLRICVDQECDYIVLNSVSNIKILLRYLQDYDVIHCYLDNDDAGAKATAQIKNAYANQAIDESTRYEGYKDVNDVVNGIFKSETQ